MDGHAQDGTDPVGFDRRKLLLGAAAAGTAAWVAPAVLRVERAGAAVASGAPAEPIFFDNFEGAFVWGPTPTGVGFSGYPSTAEANSPTRSLSFTALGSGGDSSPPPFNVTPGTSYTVSVAYNTHGGGGFFGLNEYSGPGGGGSYLGENWLFGDGTYTSQVVWDYRAGNQNAVDLDVWKTYTTTYLAPAGVFSVQLKAEQFAGGINPNAATNPVFFDDVLVTQP